VQRQGPAGTRRTSCSCWTDQERFFRPGELPAGFELPTHERLMKARHHLREPPHQLVPCARSSRSVIYTGRHIQQTRMFDNTNFPWIESLSTEVPTVGNLLRDSGYYHRLQGQVAPDEGVRDGQQARRADEDLHRGDGGLWLLRLLRCR
jgi:hypothetical protein